MVAGAGSAAERELWSRWLRDEAPANPPDPMR
jgi:hypothetical protein